MNHLERLSLTIAIIFISLVIGYWTRIICEKKEFDPEKLVILRKRLQFLAIFILLPLSAMLSLWGLPKPDIQLLWLPVLGLISYIINGIIAILMAKFLNLTPPQTGSFFCCGTFTNLGAVGSLVCLIFLGENTIALVALYRFLEDMYYFGIAFPIAKKFSTANTRYNKSYKFSVHPILYIIIFALGAGICLNLFKVYRPDYLGNVASLSTMLSTICFLYAIGLSLHISKIGSYLKPALAMCSIKFIISPLLITTIALILGFASLENGLPLKTVLILSAMPVAMTALVPPSLFNLDLHLANTCWIITTMALILVLPALLFILPQL